MAETLTTLTHLQIVREIQEDDSGATLRFQKGGQGHVLLANANYAAHLRLARRSQERQHPVGVSFGEGQTVAELNRADNDIPAELLEGEPDRVRVHFQGHDGVFELKLDHPEYTRIRATLDESLREKASVWFVAQKPELALLDVFRAAKVF